MARASITALLLAASLGLLMAPVAGASRGKAFLRFQGKVCLLLTEQNEKALVNLGGFNELLQLARNYSEFVPPQPDKVATALIGAGKDWKAVTDVAAKYNRLLVKVRPPTSRERHIWQARFRAELSVVKISRQQQFALAQADLTKYDVLQPGLVRQEHKEQGYFDRLHIHCEQGG